MYCDNNGAICQAKEPRSNKRNGHVLRRYHLIKEIIERKDIYIKRVDTDDNVSDPFTKVLPSRKHETHYGNLGLRYRSDWL